MIACNTLS